MITTTQLVEFDRMSAEERKAFKWSKTQEQQDNLDMWETKLGRLIDERKKYLRRENEAEMNSITPNEHNERIFLEKGALLSYVPQDRREEAEKTLHQILDIIKPECSTKHLRHKLTVQLD